MQNNRKSQGVTGKGYSTGLKAARQPQRNREPNSTKQITGVFVSRLDPRTTSKDVEQNIKRHTGLSIRAEKMRVKYPDSYSSFYIRCEHQVRSELLDAELWPQRCLVKPFEEK